MFRALLLLLAFLCLCYWCVTKHAPMIENNILSQTNRILLEENQQDSIHATIDGRDIILTGQVDTEQDKQRVLNAVQGFNGIRSLENTLAITPRPYPYEAFIADESSSQNTQAIATPEIGDVKQTNGITTEPPTETETHIEPQVDILAETQVLEPSLPLSELYLSISKEASELGLNGYVGSESTKEYLLNKINTQLTVNNQLKVTPLDGEWPENWQQMTELVLEQLAPLKTALVTLRPDSITFSGEADDHQIRENIEKTLRNALPRSWAMTFDINIPLSAESIACESEIQQLLNEKTIYFNLDSTEISPQSVELLESIIDNIQSCSKARFLIEGHTDWIGNGEYNLELSEWRAQAVKDFLVSKGVSATRISTKGYGEFRPIADNTTFEGQAKNRRIEFVVLGESQ